MWNILGKAGGECCECCEASLSPELSPCFLWNVWMRCGGFGTNVMRTLVHVIHTALEKETTAKSSVSLISLLTCAFE